MRPQQVRRIAFAAALGVGLVLLLLGFARPGGPAPWQPAEQRELPLAGFESPTARIALREDGLHLESSAPGVTELRHTLDPFDATPYRYLAFSYRGLPNTNKLLLTWRGEEGPRFTPLPDPIGAGGRIDLARVANWKGRIQSLGLAIVPIDYAALPDFRHNPKASLVTLGRFS